MIYMYTGTPGSGKSLHMARDIYHGLIHDDCLYLANFYINTDEFPADCKFKFIYVDNSDITPERLMSISRQYFELHEHLHGVKREGRIKLFIDEAQILFNSREWQVTYKQGWINFFSTHRHLGYDVYLITQYDRMIDRQLRSLVEYEYSHRKVSNFGFWGKLYDKLLGGGLFCVVKYWYPQKERLSSSFYRFKKKYGKLYDTFEQFHSFSDNN